MVTSRERQSIDTRTRLLEATVSCLIEAGYRGTTTSAVQMRAGVSRGALMHHFPSKAALLVAATQHLAEQRAANLITEARGLEAEPDRASQAIEMLWEVFQGPLFTATIELWTASRTDPELRDALYGWERSLRSELDGVMGILFGKETASSPAFADAIELTLVFMRGAAMTSILRRSAERQRAAIDGWKRLFVEMLQEAE